MRNKKKIVLFISLLVIVVLGFLFGKTLFKEENTKKETKKQVTFSEVANVLIIGENVRFKSTDTVKFSTLPYEKAKEKLPKETRFILIGDEEKTEPKVLKKWVNDKKVVIFYGTDISPIDVKEKIDIEFDIENSKFEANIPLNYHLFGYGYSKKYDRNMIWELQRNSNLELELSITNFLGKYGTTN